MGIGPTRHAMPPGPCRRGLRAWPSAQAQPYGPILGPCWPVKNGTSSVPGQPVAHHRARDQREARGRRQWQRWTLDPARREGGGEDLTGREEARARGIGGWWGGARASRTRTQGAASRRDERRGTSGRVASLGRCTTMMSGAQGRATLPVELEVGERLGNLHGEESGRRTPMSVERQSERREESGE